MTEKDLFIRLVNYEKEKEELAERIFRRHLDLAAVLITEPSCGRTASARYVHRDELRSLGISEDEAIESALKNTIMQYPPCMDTLSNMLGIHPECVGEEMPFPIYVISNRKGLFGANVIMYGEVMECISRMAGGDFYIIPSSVHEVLALPSGTMEPGDIKKMIESVNDTVLSPEDILSYTLYHYDTEKRELSIA